MFLNLFLIRATSIRWQGKGGLPGEMGEWGRWSGQKTVGEILIFSGQSVRVTQDNRGTHVHRKVDPIVETRHHPNSEWNGC